MQDFRADGTESGLPRQSKLPLPVAMLMLA
jgi:hypothetical protein